MDLGTHLKARHLNIDRYDGVMVFDDVVIFPLWNLSGQFVGYQQYNPNADKSQKNDPREGRYYTSLHGDKNQKPLGVWGLESYHYRSDILVIVEGVFDACRFHNHNIPCVALLNGSYKHYRNWLTCTGRKIYKVEDDHGSSLGPYSALKIPEHRGDVGDCSGYEMFGIVDQIE